MGGKGNAGWWPSTRCAGPCPPALRPPPVLPTPAQISPNLPLACSSSRLSSASPASSVTSTHAGCTHAGLYFMCSVIGRRVLVPPPTWLNWKPSRASTRAGWNWGEGG